MELVSPAYVNIMAVLAIVSGLVLSIWWVVATYWMHSREQEAKLRQIRLPAELSEVISGTPPALVIFYIFIAVSLVGYIIFVWLGGVTY